MKKILCLIALITLLSACYKKSDSELSRAPKIKTIENVDRIFLHKPYFYSFQIRERPDSIVAVPTEQYTSSNIKIIYDVPKGKLLYIKHSRPSSRCGNAIEVTFLEIHAHSPEDIGGGGWDHGKFGSGKTNVVQ